MNIEPGAFWNAAELWSEPLGLISSDAGQTTHIGSVMPWAPAVVDVDTPFRGSPGAGRVLYLQYVLGQLPLAELRRRVGLAWAGCGIPSVELPDEHWSDLFAAAGLTLNGWPIKPPVEPVTVYRTATAEHMRGQAWADSLKAAASLRAYRAEQRPDLPLNNLYRAVVPPSAIRCMVHYARWVEYVVDPQELTVELVPESVMDPGVR